MDASGASPDPKSKRKVFTSLIFGSPLKIIIAIIWAFLIISTPFGFRIDFGSSTQPPIVFLALILRNLIFYLAVFSAIRPENYHKVGYVILAIVLAFFTSQFLFAMLELVALGFYLISELLIVRELTPAVNFFVRPPLSPQSQSRSWKIILIVALELAGYLAVIIVLSLVTTDFYFLEMATIRFGYINLPALLMFLVAVVFFIIIATKKDPFHVHLQKQFTVIIPLLLAMSLYLAYRFWVFAQTYQTHDPTMFVITYDISETLNAFLLLALTLWTQYGKVKQKKHNQRYYAYILWIYTLTLYNVWFEPVFEAQGLFMIVIVFTGVGVFFMIRALTKDYASRVGLPRATKFRHLLFQEQKPLSSVSLDEIKWVDSG